MSRTTPRPHLRTALGALALLAVTAGAVQALDGTPVGGLPWNDGEATLRAAAASGAVEATTVHDAATVAPPAPVAQAAAAAPTGGPVAPPPVASRRGAIPVGTGMWIWLPERAEGGDAQAIVDRAVATGLTHIYVRTGSSRQGFHGAAFLEAILPPAHAAGLRVYGWDFPYLDDVGADVARAVAAIDYRTATGHRIDGFVPDIETRAEGTNLSAETAGAYSAQLRAAVGGDYPLVACVPHPSPQRIATFPYAAVLPHYDAVAPMSYWLNRQPDSDALAAVSYLEQFGKPVIPVGQAYDGAPEGGRPGPPPPDEIRRFLAAAEAAGATGASFWSWQHASPEIWQAIADAPEFDVPVDQPLTARQVAAVQAQLRAQGYWTPVDGTWGADTVRALSVFQIDVGLLPTGLFDAGTRAALLAPKAPSRR